MAQLVDPSGRPVSSGKNLRREQSRGGVTGVRNPFDQEVVTGLTPEKLSYILRRARDGDHFDFLAMVADLEKRDPHYFSVLQTRKLALKMLEHSVDSPSDDDQDTKETQAVRQVLNSAAFRGQILHIMDALSKGFSVSEILWDRGESDIWWPVEFKWRNPRWYQWDHETAEELRLVDGSHEGEKLDAFKYIIHVPTITSGLALAGGLGRIVSVLHLFKGYAVKDWMTFAEVFGMPIRVGKYPKGATDAEKDELREAVTNIGSDAAAIVPLTMMLEFERANASGNAGSDEFFENLANWLNKETSKAVLGQTMTVEDGSSLAQAKVHAEVRTDIRNADAEQLMDTVNRDLVRPFVDLNFGARAREEDYPRYVLDTSEPEDLTVWIQVLPVLVSLGLPIPVNFVMQLFGIPDAKDGEALLEMVQQQAKEEPGSNEEKEEKAKALLARIISEAEETTNMRVFRKRLRELLQ